MSFKSRARLYFACTFIEAAAVTVFNRLKKRLGIKVEVDSTRFFLRQFLLHAFNRADTLRITCADRTDGAGAQAHTIISAMNFARACGHTYVHTPFLEIDHADRPMDQWVDTWENLFNLGEGEEYQQPGDPVAVNYSTFHPRLYHALSGLLASIAGWAGPGRRQSTRGDTHFHPFFFYSDSKPDSYHALIPDLQRKYRQNNPVNKAQALRVAVHVRRGDVTPEHLRRFTPLGSICETVSRITSVLDTQGQQYQLAVYSEGSPEDFLDLQAQGAELHLDADAPWTMRQLVDADILVMSKSSFSYVAALLSDAICLYEPFWHAPLTSWIVRNRHGGFDGDEFTAQLPRLAARQPAEN